MRGNCQHILPDARTNKSIWSKPQVSIKVEYVGSLHLDFLPQASGPQGYNST